MATENQKIIGDFLVRWSNDANAEYYIFHGHDDCPEDDKYSCCIPDKESGDLVCRRCKVKPPAGVIYFGKTRSLNNES
jgi:hypothetical protein